MALFVLRPAQVEALSAPFRARMQADLRRRYETALAEARPGVARGDSERQLAFLVDRSMALGLRTHRTLALYVSLAVEFGPLFDTHPAIEEYLRRAVDDLDRAFEGIVEAVPATTWQRADDEDFTAQWTEAFEPASTGSDALLG